MTKIIVSVILMLVLSITGYTQVVVKKDANGNYTTSRAKAKPIDTTKYVATGSYLKIKDTSYPVWKTPTGKLVIFRISKAGNEYKQYLKVEQ